MRAFVLLFLVLLPIGCATPALEEMRAEVVSPFDDYQNWYLVRDYSWDVMTGSTITVPEGFVTDYASIPAAAQLIIPKNGPYSRAAIIHDYLYWRGDEVCTKTQADKIMYLGMWEQGADKDDRDTIYAQLQNFGAPAWNENAAERQSGLPRVIPPDLFEVLLDGRSDGSRYASWDAFRPFVRLEYAETGRTQPLGEVRVDWAAVEARFDELREEEKAPWWAFWTYLKFWQW